MSEALTLIGRERAFLRYGEKRACVKAAISYALTSLGADTERDMAQAGSLCSFERRRA